MLHCEKNSQKSDAKNDRDKSFTKEKVTRIIINVFSILSINIKVCDPFYGVEIIIIITALAWRKGVILGTGSCLSSIHINFMSFLNASQTTPFLPKFHKGKVWPPSHHRELTKQNVWVFYKPFLFCFPARGSHCNSPTTPPWPGSIVSAKLSPAACLTSSGQGIQRITSQHVYNHSGWWPVIATICLAYHQCEPGSLSRINLD